MARRSIITTYPLEKNNEKKILFQVDRANHKEFTTIWGVYAYASGYERDVIVGTLQDYERQLQKSINMC